MSLSKSTYHSSKTIGNFLFSSEKTISKKACYDFLYEKSNHLGNVHVVVSDRKLPVDDGVYDSNGNQTSSTPDGIFDYYEPDVVFAADYYDGVGMVMPGRLFVSQDHRYGAQGSEVDQEIDGTRDRITTYYRQGNLKTMRWDSPDPKTNASWSPYAMMQGNPVLYNDILGDTIKFGKGVGLLFKIKTQVIFATASLFSEEARSTLKELRESPYTTEIRKTSGMNKVIESDYEDWRNSDPISQGMTYGDPNMDKAYDEWIASKPTHKNAENGIGTNSRMYLNLSNSFRKSLKSGEFGGIKSSLIQATLHEVGHAKHISTGTAEFKMVNQTEIKYNLNRFKWEIHHYKVNKEELNTVDFENTVTRELNKSILFNKTIRKSYFGD